MVVSVLIAVPLGVALGRTVGDTSAREAGSPTATSRSTATTRPKPSSPATSRSTSRPKPKAQQPSTVQQARTTLTGSPLYGASLPARKNCADVDPSRLSHPKKQAWAERTVKNCLLPWWSGAYRKTTGTALSSVRSVTVVKGGRVVTPCGTRTGPPAFYCPGNESIYLWDGDFDRESRAWVWAHQTLAHEFTHHVQYRAGLLSASQLLVQRGEIDQWEATRRVELQAQCVQAAFTRSIADGQSGFNSYYFPYRMRWRGQKTHGSAANKNHWIIKGWESRSFCNTWTASRKRVA